MPHISTHILDTARGTPVAGVAVELLADGKVLASATTNADGRTDAPLMQADRLAAGPYEIVFHVGAWLRALGPDETPFFDDITIRFVVSGEQRNYHVPLLLSPYGYTTYRGS